MRQLLRSLALFLVLCVGFGQAQAAPPITSQQWDAFRASVKAHAADSVATAYSLRQASPIVVFYNTTSGTTVWRTAVPPGELAGAVVMSEFLGFQQNATGKQNGMLLLLQLGAGGLDASNANVRSSFFAIWAGTTTLTNLTAIGQRAGTNFEVIAAFLSTAAPSNACDPAIYGHVLTDNEVLTQLWNPDGTPR